MEEKERYAEHTVAWELPTGDSVTKGNYNLAGIETKYTPIQTSIISDDKDRKISDLEAKLAEKDKRIKELEKENKECKHWENMFHKLSTEEDNAITKVNKSLSNPMALIDDYDKWADYTLEQIKQSQKQLAIEELEKVKKLAEDLFSEFCQSLQYSKLELRGRRYIKYNDLLVGLNNQIKELGGEENE